MTVPHQIAGTAIVLVGLGSLAAVCVWIMHALIDWAEQREERQMLATSEHPYHDTIKPEQERQHADWLEQAQDAITKLSLSRESGIVSSDDVWDICPPPAGVEPRAMGAVWQPRDRWQKVGFVPSRRGVNHKRPIMQWRYLRLENIRQAMSTSDTRRDEILFAFHDACEHPTAEQIMEWTSRYPEFAGDIIAHAEHQLSWKAQPDLQNAESDEADMA